MPELITEIKDSLGMTPYLWAIRNANMECIQYLTNAGADTSVTNNGGQTALHIAAGGGKLWCE